MYSAGPVEDNSSFNIEYYIVKYKSAFFEDSMVLVRSLNLETKFLFMNLEFYCIFLQEYSIFSENISFVKVFDESGGSFQKMNGKIQN